MTRARTRTHFHNTHSHFTQYRSMCTFGHTYAHIQNRLRDYITTEFSLPEYSRIITSDIKLSTSCHTIIVHIYIHRFPRVLYLAHCTLEARMHDAWKMALHSEHVSMRCSSNGKSLSDDRQICTRAFYVSPWYSMHSFAWRAFIRRPADLHTRHAACERADLNIEAFAPE